MKGDENVIKKFFRLIGKVFLGFFLYQVILRLVRKNWHFPAPSFIGSFLDSDFRKKLQPPEVVIRRSGIKPGMRVLEIGCGSGAFAVPAARLIGEEGKLYALDIQKNMLTQLERKLALPGNTGIHNIVLVNESAYSLPFEADSVDLVYMVTVLQEIPDRLHALSEIRRVLKPGGILAVSEFLPDPDYPMRTTTIRLGEAGGFLLDKVEGNLWNYTVCFKKLPHHLV